MGIKSRIALFCGVAAGPLFTLVYLIEGALRPHYDPLRHPISSLALGESGWVQTLNFLVAGALTIAFAVGVRLVARPSLWGPLFLGLWGAGLIGAGVFVTDPVGGYPAGTPDLPSSYSAQGALHDAFSLAGFVAFAAACFVLVRSGPRWWRLYGVLSGVAFVVTMVAANMTFGLAGGAGDLAGLFQRTAITTAWAWQAVLAVRLLRAQRRDG